jgi:hypothetical protein
MSCLRKIVCRDRRWSFGWNGVVDAKRLTRGDTIETLWFTCSSGASRRDSERPLHVTDNGKG